MRFLVPVCIAYLVTAVVCVDDDDVALWVYKVVNGSQPNGSIPVANKGSGNSMLDLTPTKIFGAATVDCTTKDNEVGICVLYYQCSSVTKTVIEDGASLIDVRISNCPHYLEVCCKVGDEKMTEGSNGQPADDTTSSLNRNNNNPVWSPIETPDPSASTPSPSASTPSPSGTTPGPSAVQCGRNNSGSLSPFVHSNKNAEKSNAFALFGDFPWMVAVLKQLGYSAWSQSDYLGGGTLIHPSVVMTVAHKIWTKRKNYTATELKCRAGEWDTQFDAEQYKHQERNVQNYVIHEGYYATSQLNDIALLFLEKPFDLAGAPHIGPACLSPAPPPPGRVCYSMGWGRIDPKNSKTFANVLKKVLLHPVERNTCQTQLRATRLGEHFNLHQSLTCAAGDTNVDTCRGDGGSSLVCAISDDPGETRFAVHGMVVYGIKCFDPEVPGVYADTAFLKPWIDSTMQRQGYDASYYTL